MKPPTITSSSCSPIPIHDLSFPLPDLPLAVTTRPTLPTAPPSQPIKPAANNNITITRLDPTPHLKPTVISKIHISPHTVIPSSFPYSPLRRSPSQSSPQFNLFFRSSQSLSKPSQTMSVPQDLNLFMSSPSSPTHLPNPHLQTLILLSFELKKTKLLQEHSSHFPIPASKSCLARRQRRVQVSYVLGIVLFV